MCVPADHLPCVMLKRLGDRMAGHRKRKKIDAEIRLSLMSSRPMAARRSLNMWKHSRSSLQSTKHNDLIMASFIKLYMQQAIKISHKYCVSILKTQLCVNPHSFPFHTEVLHYKLEDHWFNSWWSHRIFHWLNPAGCTTALGLAQLLTEMSTMNISAGAKAAGA